LQACLLRGQNWRRLLKDYAVTFNDRHLANEAWMTQNQPPPKPKLALHPG
jgi:hypothetical protein